MKIAKPSSDDRVSERHCELNVAIEGHPQRDREGRCEPYLQRGVRAEEVPLRTV
jgi:hypothetical protein